MDIYSVQLDSIKHKKEKKYNHSKNIENASVNRMNMIRDYSTVQDIRHSISNPLDYTYNEYEYSDPKKETFISKQSRIFGSGVQKYAEINIEDKI